MDRRPTAAGRGGQDRDISREDEEVGLMESMRLLRLKFRKKQTAIAEYVGVSVNTYRRWEAGTAEPSFSQIRKLAEAFGFTSYRFFKFLCGGRLH